MPATIKLETNLDEQLDKLKELVGLLNQTEEKVNKLRFITIREFAEISGWNITTVRELFCRKDFPSCDFGKEKIAEVSAVINYFSVPRRK